MKIGTRDEREELEKPSGMLIDQSVLLCLISRCLVIEGPPPSPETAGSASGQWPLWSLEVTSPGENARQEKCLLMLREE